MIKYGQVEYAYYLLKQISQKMLAKGILTDKQLEMLNEKNKEECFNSFSTTNSI